MATPVYSQQFGLWSHKDNGGPIYPPAGTLLVLRQVTVFNGNTLSFLVGFGLFEWTSGAKLVTNTWPVDENGSFYWEGRIVIPETQAFAWDTSVGAGTAELDVYLGGYTLQAP